MIDFEIQHTLHSLREAISKRQQIGKGDPKLIRAAEEEVCVESRTLVSRFVDAAMLVGVSIDIVEAVRNSLNDAVKCVEVDMKSCGQSISGRRSEFEAFLKRNPDVVRRRLQPA